MHKRTMSLVFATTVIMSLCVYAGPPANAARGGGSTSCGPIRTKLEEKRVEFDLFGRPHTWNIDAILKFQYCEFESGAPYLARVYGYRVKFTTPDDVSCNRPGADGHEYWRVNPNVIGSWIDWNPEEKQQPCYLSSGRVFTWGNFGLTGSPPSYEAVVDPYADANRRCLGAHVTAVVAFYNDPERDLPSICLYEGIN